MQKKILVCGAGGFIGSHLVHRLKAAGAWVRGVDIKYPEFSSSPADDFVLGDLRDLNTCRTAVDRYFDEVYQLAADMGGAGYVFTGENDASIMHSSALVNINMITACQARGIRRIFYSSSACVYPVYNQNDPECPLCSEDSVYPAQPDSDYGWEKLFSERLYLAYARNYGLEPRIARYHNVYGPEGSWNDGREKAPAALCRKVAVAENGEPIEIWGDGTQTRSFLYIDDCLDATIRFMRSDWTGPVNIGSEEMVSIGKLATMIMSIADKELRVKQIPGPVGVMGRCSDNGLIQEKLGWRPAVSLLEGLGKTYAWIATQISGLAPQGSRAERIEGSRN